MDRKRQRPQLKLIQGGRNNVIELTDQMIIDESDILSRLVDELAASPIKEWGKMLNNHSYQRVISFLTKK